MAVTKGYGISHGCPANRDAVKALLQASPPATQRLQYRGLCMTGCCHALSTNSNSTIAHQGPIIHIIATCADMRILPQTLFVMLMCCAGVQDSASAGLKFEQRQLQLVLGERPQPQHEGSDRTPELDQSTSGMIAASRPPGALWA